MNEVYMRGGLQTPRSARGVGLIEVLVAVLVLAIGLLGLAALQATALRRSQSGLERSQAVIETYSILDAMRANRAAAAAGEYNLSGAAGCEPPGATDTLAKRDLANWNAALQRDLGAGACGSIAVAAAGNQAIADVSVTWNDERGGGEAAQTLKTSTAL